jgi:hypothetical protein
MNLLPYILGEAAHCAATGEPLLRPLLLDDPDDREAWRIQDQYRFGRDLLVVPVVEEGATARRLYLPRGTWHDLWGGAALAGGRWIEVDAPIERIPVYVRAGALLPLNLSAAGALCDDVGNATDRYERLNFWIYPEARTENQEPRTGPSQPILYGGPSVAASYDWVDATGVRRHFVIEQLPDGVIQVDLPPLPFDVRLAIPGGASIDVEASDQARRVRLEQRAQ